MQVKLGDFSYSFEIIITSTGLHRSSDYGGSDVESYIEGKQVLQAYYFMFCMVPYSHLIAYFSLRIRIQGLYNRYS